MNNRILKTAGSKLVSLLEGTSPFSNPKLVRDDLLRSVNVAGTNRFRVSVRFSRDAAWRFSERRRATPHQLFNHGPQHPIQP
jgi:hypothetical protein